MYTTLSHWIWFFFCNHNKFYFWDIRFQTYNSPPARHKCSSLTRAAGDSVLLSLTAVVSYWLPSWLLQVTWYELTSSGNVSVSNALRQYVTLSNQLAILDADWTAGTTRTFFAPVLSTNVNSFTINILSLFEWLIWVFLVRSWLTCSFTSDSSQYSFTGNKQYTYQVINIFEYIILDRVGCGWPFVRHDAILQAHRELLLVPSGGRRVQQRDCEHELCQRSSRVRPRREVRFLRATRLGCFMLHWTCTSDTIIRLANVM